MNSPRQRRRRTKAEIFRVGPNGPERNCYDCNQWKTLDYYKEHRSICHTCEHEKGARTNWRRKPKRKSAPTAPPKQYQYEWSVAGKRIIATNWDRGESSAF